MNPDPVVEEVRKARRELSARFNHDVHALAEFARKQQETSGHKVVSFEKKRKTG